MSVSVAIYHHFIKKNMADANKPFQFFYQINRKSVNNEDKLKYVKFCNAISALDIVFLMKTPLIEFYSLLTHFDPGMWSWLFIFVYRIVTEKCADDF